jgi:hypothetical protein
MSEAAVVPVRAEALPSKAHEGTAPVPASGRTETPPKDIERRSSSCGPRTVPDTGRLAQDYRALRVTRKL